MTAFLAAGRKTFAVKVPTSQGRYVKRTTGTRLVAVRDEIEQMLRELGPRGKKAWDLLDAVAAHTLTVSRLHDHWRADTLDVLRAQLDDVDLRGHVPGFLAWMGQRARSIIYLSQIKYRIETLVRPETPFLRSAFTEARVTTWLSEVRGSNTTRRGYYSAATLFVRYLRIMRVLRSNPLELVVSPTPNRPRMTYLAFEDMQRLVARFPTAQLRALEAVFHSGAEFQPALAITRRDVLPPDDQYPKGRVRCPGTKEWARDRVLVLEPWAWAHVWAWAKDKLPAAPLFDLDGAHWKLAYKRHRKLHAEVVVACGLPAGYNVHDARHSYAVDALSRLGYDVMTVAHQLGHRDGSQVNKNYGRYVVRPEHFTERLGRARGRGGSRSTRTNRA